MTFPPLPPPPTSNLVIFSPTQWHWLTLATAANHMGAQALFEALGPLVSAMEMTMAAVDDLKAQNEDLKAAFVALGEAVSRQIQQLVDAKGNEAAIAAVVEDMKATNTKAREFVSSMGADDTPAPPVA